MKNNYKNLIFIGVVVILLTVGGYLAFRKKPEPVVQTNISISTSNSDLQTKCEIQAQSVFSSVKKDMAGDSSRTSEKSHFNQKLNKCFVLVSYKSINDDKDYASEDILLDVNNNKLAQCTYIPGRIFGNPYDCQIGDQGNVSDREFQDFINQKMEFSQ